MSTVILFLIVLSVLVFVHEAGHFFAARRNGMRVDEFGFGFPPRIAGVVRLRGTRRWRFVWGNPKRKFANTVYSINWIPLGGFVKIKGEDGADSEASDSFASKSPWIRFKVLSAGVAMNFILGWMLFSFVMAVGFPREVDPEVGPKSDDARVQILNVSEDSPAKEMGLRMGDVIVGVSDKGRFISATSVEKVRTYILDHKGIPVTLEVQRGNQRLALTGIPRTQYDPSQGSLGIHMIFVETVRTPLLLAPWEGLKQIGILVWLILTSLGGLVVSILSGSGVSGEVAGPIGIAYMTKQVSDLGFLYLLQFTAILSVNLGILNVLPIPALDGGRIFFVLIEMIKGSPVSQKVEQWMHSFGFMALLLLMLIVTLYDFGKFHIFDSLF